MACYSRAVLFISVNLDFGSYADGVCILDMRRDAKFTSLNGFYEDFDVMVTSQNGKTAVVVTFGHVLIAQTFYEDFARGGFDVDDAIAGTLDYKATLSRTFYEEAAPDEIPKGGMAIIIRGAPTARASVDYYVNYVREHFGDAPRSTSSTSTRGADRTRASPTARSPS